MKVRHTLMAVVLAATAILVNVEPLAVAVTPPSTMPMAEPRPQPNIKTIKKPAPPRKQAASRSARTPAWAVDFQRCVIGHESLTSGLYKAQNPTTSASGAYQFVDNTWRHYARIAGFGSKYSRAKYAPPSVQDAVFFTAVLRGDFYHWKGTDCGYGT